MASDNGQTAPNSSSEFSDETIRRFLLGDLSAAEQPAFEQRLLIDHGLAARVRLAEFELADDYADESLVSGERELVEEAFLLSADREQKVRVSRSLREHFAPAPVSSVASPAATYLARLRSAVNFARPAWRFAVAAVIFILLIGTVWVVVKKEGRIKEEITKHLPRRRSPNPIVPVESNHPTNNSTPDHRPASSPMPVHEQPPLAPGKIISLTPVESSDDSNLPFASLPKGDSDIVRLQLALKGNQPERFRVEVLTSEGSSIFTSESIAAGGSTPTNFDVPARLLKSGNYQIRLVRENAGASEEVGSYYFRVQ